MKHKLTLEQAQAAYQNAPKGRKHIALTKLRDRTHDALKQYLRAAKRIKRVTA